VDNELLIRWSLGERLRLEGYEVSEAPPGPLALESIGRGVDLIILGCEVDTPEACRLLSRLKCLAPHVSLIVLTTCTAAETAAKAMQLGASAVVRKPFGLDRITEAARAALMLRAIANSYAPA
jgi:DNA-binding NtrC family response regulator